ncbi:MAG TPA: NAD+ synthase, partial [Candidatus Bathyarchaeia archaeon]|nr:NAD+ synthase [Candidatus Bathyarchaeia archaeon]
SQFELDWDKVRDEITLFIQTTVDASHAKGCVIGMSGGVDSSLVAGLLTLALGKAKVLGVMMPAQFTPKTDLEDAQALADQLQIRSVLVPIQPIADSFAKALAIPKDSQKARIPLANILARARMTTLYYYANLHNYLVAGTGDRSEDLIGYFTKYGDGGVDFRPISHLYKTQVRELARHLQIPLNIVTKPSSPQLYPGHRATDEIPVDYDRLDKILRLLFDEGRAASEVARTEGVSQRIVEDVLSRYRVSAHKRSYPTMVRPW